MVQDTEEARLDTAKYPRPLNVIEGPLMKVTILCISIFFVEDATFLAGNVHGWRIVWGRENVPSASDQVRASDEKGCRSSDTVYGSRETGETETMRRFGFR